MLYCYLYATVYIGYLTYFRDDVPKHINRVIHFYLRLDRRYSSYSFYENNSKPNEHDKAITYYTRILAIQVFNESVLCFTFQ